MHYSTFVIIDGDADPEPAVATALQPFHEALEVKPYRRYLDASEIQHIAAHYGLPPTDLPGLARKMQDWWSCEGGVDARGLYAVTTLNPDGKWDWYDIGGRWDRYIPGSRGNVIGARTLLRSRHLRKCLPYYLLTPDGRWFESAIGWRIGPPKTPADRLADRRWFALVRRVLKRFIGHKVVCVDIHS